ncbi:MAG: GNAT family N-acetyltransferase [Actinomycetota bacterium]
MSTSNIEIRPVRPEEMDEAGRVTANAYREFATPGRDWESYLVRLADVADRSRRTEVLVAVEDGQVLGTVTLELTGRTDAGRGSQESAPLEPGQAHVRMLGVAPEARGRGVGRMLMEACLAEARRAGKAYLTLNTTERMRAARAMYRSMGFTRMEDTVFPDGFVLLGYRIELDGATPGDR